MSGTLEQHQQLINGLKSKLQEDLGEVEEIQTHISTVLLVGKEAYKIKKPLDLGFLDFSTLEKRRHCCEEEIRLNGRLAPQIYRDVVEIRGNMAHPQLRGDTGEIIEYAVHMRRFSQEGLLAQQAKTLQPETARAIASRLARFHGEIAAAPTESDFGAPERAMFPMRENFQQIRGLVDNPEALERLALLDVWTEAQFSRLTPLLAVRKAEGFIRECHGDLHLGNIALVEGEVVIFDGIEFNPNLRWIDTINEMAFLLMDLDERGRPDLSGIVLNRYLEESGDYAALPLLRFYQVYRAMVRAKISVIRLAQPDLSEAEKTAVYRDFFGYLGRAESYTAAAVQGLVLTCGVSGSGKSTVTDRLIMERPVVRVRSDVERKRLAGLAANDDSKSALDAGIYTAEFSQRCYARLLEVVDPIIAGGFIAVVDATFLELDQRQPFIQKAEDDNLPWAILDFQVSKPVLEERIARRQAQGGDPSEADVTVMNAQLKGRDALNAVESAHSITIGNDGEFNPKDLDRLLGFDEV